MSGRTRPPTTGSTSSPRKTAGGTVPVKRPGLGSARSPVSVSANGVSRRTGTGTKQPASGRSNAQSADSEGGPRSRPMSRVSSTGECRRTSDGRAQTDGCDEPPRREDDRGAFHTIEQLAALEATLFCVLDGLKQNTPHVSFFCREYWGTSASHAILSLERMGLNERLKRQVQQAGVLESLSLAVTSHLCSGVMQGVSVTIRSRLRNLLYYVHENCLVLLDLVCQQWLVENPDRWASSDKRGHCPENLNLDILVGVQRYRCLRKGEHVMALRQHNDMIANVVRQLCRGAATRRPTVSGPRRAGDRSPGDRSPGAARGGSLGVLAVVDEMLTTGTPLDRLRASIIRNRMLQHLRFCPLLNSDGDDPDCPWPEEDPFVRYGTETFATTGPIIWFEPLPPMYPDLELGPKLPPLQDPTSTYTLVLDLDETLVHYFEQEGLGNYGIRPGALEFLQHMNALGYELVIFTAATQDYADWVINQIDPDGLIHYRLYRQHALPWGPIFVKDLSRLGRDLDRTLIIDNIEENFRLQPRHGIFIYTWYDDPADTALPALTPLLDELITTRALVPDILEKYRDQIPVWAGFDQYIPDQELSELDPGFDDNLDKAYVADDYPEESDAFAPANQANATQGKQQPQYQQAMLQQQQQQQVPSALQQQQPVRQTQCQNYMIPENQSQQVQATMPAYMASSTNPGAQAPYPSNVQDAQAGAGYQQPLAGPPVHGHPQQHLPQHYQANQPQYHTQQPSQQSVQPTQPAQQPLRSTVAASVSTRTQAPAPKFSGVSGAYQAPLPTRQMAPGAAVRRS